MQDRAREIFLDVSRRLNDDIRALSESLKGEGPSADLLEGARRSAASGLSRLRALRDGAGVQDPSHAKVLEHLDLFAELTGTVESAPALAAKLLDHLLEEQIEITEAAAAAGPVAAAAPAPSGPVASEAGGSLAGGRRPLTVGSLIGR